MVTLSVPIIVLLIRQARVKAVRGNEAPVVRGRPLYVALKFGLFCKSRMKYYDNIIITMQKFINYRKYIFVLNLH